MKKLINALIMLLLCSSLYAQKQVDGLKVTFNDNGVKTQTIQLDSIIEWGYDLATQKILIKPIKGNSIMISPNNFFQFEFSKITQSNLKKELFSGYVQKGPYANGSSITMTQLDEYLNQTGRVFSTQIIDNAGSFEQRNIEFASNFVELKADGYYFNEVKGATSTSPLTLYGLVDINDLSTVNVNVLTHLERQRIMYLIQNNKLSFSDAKKQARSEVLNIFKLALPGDMAAESLNITDNALLLVVSSIIQGHLSTGDMSELLANISSDIRTDGRLDNPVLGSQLLNNAVYIDWDEVKSNLDKKYNGLGIKVNVNSAELKNYAQQFMNNCGFNQTSSISYPERGKYGLNILNEGLVEANSVGNGRVEYSLKADLPEGKSSLKIILISKNSPKYVDDEHEYEIPWGGFMPDTNENWLASNYDVKIHGNTFTVFESGKPADLKVIFSDDCIVEYYENGSTVPTKVKEIKVLKE